MRWLARRSTRPTRWTSGTWSTGRTGPCARACSGGCRAVCFATVTSPPWRTRTWTSAATWVSGSEERTDPMTRGLRERLEDGVVLGDGGYVLGLEKRGYVQAGPFTPEVVIEHPAAVRELHQEFLDAGAEVLQSLAFYASKEKLATTGFADRVGEINREAVRLARDVAGDRALVAANLSLTWMYDPKDGASSDKVRALFDEQLNAQLRESPDFVVAETFSWLREALLAVERIEKTGLPSMVTMSFDKNPVSYDGRTPAEGARALRHAGADIVGVDFLRDPMLP